MVEECYVRLGERVEALRRAVGSSQDDMARRVHMSRANWGKIERGEIRVDLHTAALIARAIGTTPQHLLKSIWSISDKEG